MTTYNITTVNNGKVNNITVNGEDNLYSKVMDFVNKGIIVLEIRTQTGELVCL